MPRNPSNDRAESTNAERSEFAQSLRTGALIGLALLVCIVPPLRMHKARQAAQEQAARVAEDPTLRVVPQLQPPSAVQPQAPAVRLADFKGEDASADARLVANWVLTTANNHRRAFILVDKKDARVFVFTPEGKLVDSAPALLGSARGDNTYPGVGDKPLSAVRPEEKTTPAGRFVAEPGINASKEDVIWVDYDAAVSMHRIRPLVARERRLERLASLTVDDNRISFGCINLPVSFYENVANPTVRKYGAIVYVLPDVKTVQQVFGAFDVTDPQQLAAAQQAAAQAVSTTAPAASVQKVALQGQAAVR